MDYTDAALKLLEEQIKSRGSNGGKIKPFDEIQREVAAASALERAKNLEHVRMRPRVNTEDIQNELEQSRMPENVPFKPLNPESTESKSRAYWKSKSISRSSSWARSDMVQDWETLNSPDYSTIRTNIRSKYNVDVHEKNDDRSLGSAELRLAQIENKVREKYQGSNSPTPSATRAQLRDVAVWAARDRRDARSQGQ